MMMMHFQQPQRLALALTALVAFFPAGVHASVDETAKITLASLLGGVPALGILMMIALCLWIRKRKRELRAHALANGIELDADGWPVDRNPDLELARAARERQGLPPLTTQAAAANGNGNGNRNATNGNANGNANADSKVPPPPYLPPAPSYSPPTPTTTTTTTAAATVTMPTPTPTSAQPMLSVPTAQELPPRASTESLGGGDEKKTAAHQSTVDAAV